MQFVCHIDLTTADTFALANVIHNDPSKFNAEMVPFKPSRLFLCALQDILNMLAAPN
jgi:hypothetical protein